jgi:heme O synthase-like polyprenyltransferase
MLPVVVGEARAARAVQASAILLVAASLAPAAAGLGFAYLIGAAAGGAYLLSRCAALVRAPGRATARAAFLASLVQLCAVLGGAMIDAAIG